MAKYQITTDKGTYEIETEDPKGPDLAQLQEEDKPLQNVSLTPVTENDLNQAGEDIATSKFGQQHPIAGAALGTAVAKAPDILAAVQGVQAAPELAAGVEAGGKALINGGKSLIEKAGGVINTLKGPTLEEAKAMKQVAEAAYQPETAMKAERFAKNVIDPVKAEVDSISSRLAQLPGKTADKMKMLQERLSAAGKEMGAAEDAAGFGFKSTPEFEEAVKNPKTMQKTLKVAEDFVKAGPNKVAETTDPKTIQQVRKLIQEGGKTQTLSELGNATMQQGREVAAKALGIIDKRFGAAREQYQEVADAIKSLEQESPRLAQGLKAQLKEAKIKLSGLQADAKDLMAAAKEADKARLLDIKQKSLDLIRRGVEHDRLVRGIKSTLYTLGGVGAAGFGVKKALKGH